MEYESLAVGELTEEEYKEITGDEIYDYWGGDFPPFDLYNTFSRREFDLLTKDRFLQSIKDKYKKGYFIYLDNTEDSYGSEFMYCDTYSDLLLKLNGLFVDLKEDEEFDEYADWVDNEMGDAELWLFIEMLATEIEKSKDKELLNSLGIKEELETLWDTLNRIDEEIK